MPTDRKRKEYINNYKKTKLRRIPLEVKPEEYEKIKASADRAGLHVATYIKKAIAEKMERENPDKA